MMWVTMALLAVVLGLILFSSFQEHVPPEFDWLLPKKAAQVQVVEQTAVVTADSGWKVLRNGNVVELSKKFEGSVKAGAYEYDAPVIGIMCDGADLHLRVDAQAPVTGLRDTPVRVGQAESTWFKAQGTNVLAPDAKKLASTLARAKSPVAFEFSFLDVGWAGSRLDTTGLKALTKELPEACRF